MGKEDRPKAPEIPLIQGARILEVDNLGLVALEKPPEVMTHPNKPGISARSLVKAEYDPERERYFWAAKDGSLRNLFLLNRLDSPTSGIVLAALDETLAKAVRKQFADHKVKKVYYAIVEGAPSVKSAVWVDRLSRKSKGANDTVRVERKGELRAETAYQWIRNDRNHLGLSLLKLQPKTGRMHQLRVQCSWHRHPIIGDRKYGHFRLNRDLQRLTRCKRLFLHACELRVSFQYKGKARHFLARSRMPDDFNALLEPNKARQRR